jgi:uncharacterized repeat protein (TIGR02543 family)
MIRPNLQRNDPVGKHEIDGGFSFTLSPQGGCDTASISATVQDQSPVSGTGETICWPQTTCHLAVYTEVDSVVTLVGPTGDYNCQATATLAAYPYNGYDFVGWYGDVSSADPVIIVPMNGHDRTETALFVASPPPWRRDGCGDDCSPIVINFADGDYRLTGRNAPVLFDIAATGQPARIGWTAAGADEGFLWMDRNGNGKVDNGAELFGTATRLRNGTLATNGFEALRELDTNGDGIIDANDASWPMLLVWRDRNHNGISEPAEIMPLAQSGVVGIGLSYHYTARRDLWGNTFRYESLIWMQDSRGHHRSRAVYDIFFVPVH